MGNINTKSIGNKTEAIILAELVKKDYVVLLPFGDNERYDLVVDISGIFIRIQCKTATKTNGTICFSVRSVYLGADHKTIRNPYSSNDIDCFMVYSSDVDKIYIIDVTDAGSSEIKLRIDNTEQRGGSPIRWARDYEFKDFGEILKRLKRAAR